MDGFMMHVCADEPRDFDGPLASFVPMEYFITPTGESLSTLEDESSGEGLMTNRWLQLVASVVAMVMIANLQYAWTMFVKRFRRRPAGA
jgi:hypothetical protein